MRSLVRGKRRSRRFLRSRFVCFCVVGAVVAGVGSACSRSESVSESERVPVRTSTTRPGEMADAGMLARAQMQTRDVGPARFDATYVATNGAEVSASGEVDWIGMSGTALFGSGSKLAWANGQVTTSGSGGRSLAAPLDPTSSVEHYIIAIVDNLGAVSSDNTVLLLQQGFDVIAEDDDQIAYRIDDPVGVTMEFTVDRKSEAIVHARISPQGRGTVDINLAPT